eukprot:2452707-Rhodomonas_salina.1
MQILKQTGKSSRGPQGAKRLISARSPSQCHKHRVHWHVQGKPVPGYPGTRVLHKYKLGRLLGIPTGSSRTQTIGPGIATHQLEHTAFQFCEEPLGSHPGARKFRVESLQI